MDKKIVYIDGWRIPKITGLKIGYNKLWGDGSGRDMTGTDVSTLIGFFPKLFIDVGSFTEDEMSSFLKKVNKKDFTIQWYDVESKSLRTADKYYCSDVEIEYKTGSKMLYQPFSFNLIPLKKRG